MAIVTQVSRNFPTHAMESHSFRALFRWHIACIRGAMRLFAISGIALLACAQAIPDLETLLKEAQANQHKMDDVRDNYTFHRLIITDELDEKGTVIKTTSTEREVFFVNGRQIGRLVKRNGIELKGSEEKNEQARVTNMVKLAMKSGPRAGRGRGNISMISEILPMAKISNPRRISFHGRSTLAFDFIGDPHARAKDTTENAVKKMAGAIWWAQAPQP